MKSMRVLLSLIFWLGLSTSSIAETISAKIVGGSSVVSAPSWIAAIWITTGSETSFCGGTLVDSQWIITAAHCVNEATSSSVITVKIGQKDISDYPNNSATVDTVYIYSDFNSDSLYGDIALLHLTTTQSNTPISLPYTGASSSLAVGTAMQIYGWGETSANVTQTNATTTDILQTAAITYTGFKSNYPGVIFAGGDDTDTCFGDSGGPLVYNNIQYGITSFGVGDTCAAGAAGGYTDVSQFSSWIDSSIAGTASSTSSSDSSGSSGGGGDIEVVMLGVMLLLLRIAFRFKL